MQLRQYQQAMVDGVQEQWRTHRSTLLVACTAAGKTVVSSEIIRLNQPGRALFLAHTTELVAQAKSKIEEKGIACEVEKAEQYAATSLFHRTPVIVSSIQTQCSGPRDRRRYSRFSPDDFSLLICDEAHRSASPSWKETIAYYQRNPKLKVLGMTATPDRTDKESLGQIFESVAYKYDILDGIEDGYLVGITQQFVAVKGLDYSHIRTTAGDLNEGELRQVMELESNVQGICQPTLEVMFGLAPKTLSAIAVTDWREYLSSLQRRPRRTIVFTVSVLQAEMCCNVMSRAMSGIEWVCGETNKDKRADTLHRFLRGETHAVINCSCLAEGYDNPWVEVVVMARPTKSRGLYSQQVGRSTRTLPGLVDSPELDTPEKRRAAIAASAKPFCRVIDFVGNSGKHKLITCMDILDGNVSDEAVVLAVKKARMEGKPVRVLVSVTNAEKELERRKREEAERRRQDEEARRKRLLFRVDYNMRDVNPFHNGDRSNHGKPVVKRGGRPFSKKQARFIRNWCGKDPNQIPYGYGVKLIAEKKAQWDKQKGQAA